MPGFDRTGPVGAGPMTGGGFGYCAGRLRPRMRGYAAQGPDFGPGFGRRGFGRGFGFGQGRGFGMRAGRGLGWGSYWEFNPEDEKEMLRVEAAELKSTLDLLEKRLADLERRASNPADAAVD